jgi:hypothetical protein
VPLLFLFKISVPFRGALKSGVKIKEISRKAKEAKRQRAKGKA